MTVKELIECLKQYPDDMNVVNGYFKSIDVVCDNSMMISDQVSDSTKPWKIVPVIQIYHARTPD